MITRRTMVNSMGACLTAFGLPARAESSEQSFSPDVVQEDLNTIWSALHEVSPDPFRAARPSVVQAAFRRARAGLRKPMTMRAAWLAIAPVLGALNDGHVALGFDDTLNRAAQRFPLNFSTNEQSDLLLVERDRTGVIPSNSRVISVEGVSAAEFLRTTLGAFGGQTPALARWRVGASGAWTAVALFGAKPSYRVRWIEASGAERAAAIVAGASTVHRTATEPYNFHWLRKGVGLIDYRRCEDLERFRSFLNTTFTELKSDASTALIIDIRHNPGGDSDLNDLLWSYAQAKPFKQFGGTVARSSDLLKQTYGQKRYAKIYGEQAWAAPEGAIIRQEVGPSQELVMPGPLAVRFTGPVYLLISAGTFSSGMSCALAAKDYGLATIVGQETGEPVNGTGELYALTTPNLRLQAFLTTKLFLAPKPHSNGQGVVPDVYVGEEPTGAYDPVLERTLALIDAQSAA